MTFYLKYRPKTVDELDLPSVRDRLSRIVKLGKFSHAYLFSGPRGTGKTSAARILAQAAGAKGVDVIEMDAASNRGIDDIREIREKFWLAPLQGNRKVYIIDEAHMLTPEAFNALLKSLEEPPEHVIFFLCTTEVQKLPKTVVSRCVSVAFEKAREEEIVRSLLRVAKGEKFKAEDEALKRVARAADGSFREAQTLLEEAVSAAEDKKVTLVAVEKILGWSISESVYDYVAGVIKGDSLPALAAVKKVVKNGGNIMEFAREILEEVRGRLLGERTPRVLAVAKILEIKVRTIKYSLLPQLPLEIAAIELGSEHSENSESQKAGEPENQKIRESENRKTAYPVIRPSDSLKFRPSESSEFSESSPSVPIALKDFLSKWPMILDSVKQTNHGIVTLLSLCRPVSVEGSKIVIQTLYRFHQEQLEQDRFRRLVETASSEIVGARVHIDYRLAPKTQETLKKQFQDDNISAVEEIFKL